jgi:ABC-type multidrug transport system fused ATPase/permease subunit
MIHQAGSLVENKPVDLRVLRRLFSLIRPYRRQAIASLLLMLLASLTTLAGPYLVKLAIDTAIGTGDLRRLNMLVALFILVHLLNWLASYGQQYLMALVGHQAVYDLRTSLFAHLQHLPLRFFDKQSTGRLMSRVTNDTEALTDMISGGLPHIVGDSLLLFGIIVIMLHEHWQMALLTFTTLPLLVLAATLFRNRVLQAYRQVREKIADVNANLQESISGVRVIQSFTSEEENAERFERVNFENYAANMQAVTLFSFFLPFVEVIGALGTAIVLWYGGGQAVQNLVELGTLYLFLDYVSRFYAPIRDLSQVYNSLQSALAAAEKIYHLLDIPAEQDKPGAVVIPRAKGHLLFESVCFAYEQGQEVLTGISFEIQPGQTVALVGPTGAGKTTLINLLCRFYTPAAGRVLLDGHDIAAVTLASLREQIGLVLQDTYIFDLTVRENILFGSPEATEQEMLAATRAVDAHSFILGLPEGYDTRVYERGALLSAGQRQLIAFARAFLRKPSILILDEATASVDTHTESRIQEALRTLRAGRTSVVIAHRLSTVESADKVIVMDHGRIIQEGNHRDLSCTAGLYRDTLLKMR